MSEDKLELHIQRELVEFLRSRGWHVDRMLANAYQTGIPDLYCYHKKWGARWIEVKRPNDYSFTRAQRRKWPEWKRAGIPIFILTAATQEQYDLLFKTPNWREFWRPSFQVPDVDALFDELVYEREKELACEGELHLSADRRAIHAQSIGVQTGELPIPGSAQASNVRTLTDATIEHGILE